MSKPNTVELLTDGTMPCTPMGYVSGKNPRHVKPADLTGVPTTEVSAHTVAYGLILAGWRDIDVLNYLRSNFDDVPTFMWYRGEVTEGFVTKRRLELVDMGLMKFSQYGKASAYYI